MTLVAVGTCFYVRAQRRHRICVELYGFGCPVVHSSSISPADVEGRFYRANLGQTHPNDVQWMGTAPAVLGLWEFKRFTVLVDAGRLSPIYQQEPRIRSLIVQLEGIDTIVIGAGENPNIFSHPSVASFVKELQKARPSIRVIAQRYVIVG